MVPKHPAELTALQAQVAANPLSAAPATIRVNVWRAWCCYQHLFPSPLPLAALFGVWVREYQLAEDDANDLLAGLLMPSVVGGIRFASDLTSLIGTHAMKAIRRRAEIQEMVSRRECDQHGDEQRAFIRQTIGEIAAIWNDPVESSK